MTRRQLWGWGAGGAAAALLFALGRDKPPSQSRLPTPILDEEWLFLNHPLTTADHIPASQVVKVGVPLGTSEMVYSPNKWREHVTSAAPKIGQKLLSEGLVPNDFELRLTSQSYGMPAPHRVAASLEQYSQQALAYLEASVEGLTHGDLEFVILKHGDDFTHDPDRKIFLGDHYYEVFRVAAFDKATGEMNCEVARSTREFGNACVIRFSSPDNTIYERFGFLYTQPGAIIGIPSEVIPHTTCQRSLAFGEERGRDNSRLAEESLVEGMSLCLGYRMGRAFDIPDFEQHLQSQRHAFAQHRIYRYVEQSLAWFQKNSLQAGFDLYMDNPDKFMQAILK